MKSEKEIHVSLSMHREALSYTREQFKRRLEEMNSNGQIEADMTDEEERERLYLQMQQIEKAIIRELEWVLGEERLPEDVWVNDILKNL